MLTSVGSEQSIGRLHQDILWKIFTENTNEDEPLTTARRSSQVCRQWRTIVLQSASIWGRSIDLDDLHQKTDDWRQEVISRTGQSLLWIFGSLSPDTLHFFVPFIAQNWKRVRMLGIDDFDINPEEDRQRIWAFLEQPAPNLQMMDIALSPSGDDNAGILPACLFNDHAPALEEFIVSAATYKFAANASWLPNLRKFTLCEAFSTMEIFKILQRMPLLESLHITSSYSLQETGILNLPPINLPKLNSLTLRGHFVNFLSILESVMPSSDCGLGILGDPSVWTPVEDNGENERLQNGVMKHIIPFLTLYPPTTVHCFISEETLKFQADNAPRGHRSFYFPINLHFIDSPPVKKLISSSCFSSTQELKLGLWGPREGFNNLTLSNNTTMAVPTITCLLQTFSSITTLSTVDMVLDTLLKYPAFDPTNAFILFPALQVLKIADPHRPRSANEMAAHHRFLKYRYDVAFPISVLEIRVSEDWEAFDIDYLEEHHGLLIKWTNIPDVDGVGEYRCGDGRPEQLRFTTVKLESMK